MTTPHIQDDIARCNGQDLGECADCLRRTSPFKDARRVVYLWPPVPIAGQFCEYYIPPMRAD